jgi:hypothetical protein
MFERFTEKARRTLFFARFEASQSGSPAIEPEHMLLGVLRENEELFVKLTSFPDASRALRKSIQHHFPQSELISTSVELPLSAATKSVLMRAFEESDAMGHKHIGTEHLLLGLLGEQESYAAKALQISGISAGNIRDVVGTGVREKTVPARTLLERLKETIFECLDETFKEVHGVYLDKGCSLFPTLESVSAQEASRSVSPDSATLAAQVEHVRFYLDVLNDIMRDREIVKVDWKEIWRTISQVTPEEWEQQKESLRQSHERIMATLKSFDTWDGEYEIAGALSILSHTAYHLGGLRQALSAIRSAKKEK